ncbi:NAD(P)/FAD-dependent oxidoreductase [Labilibaculum sp. A4]|uniref:NAD(P)/FAD-dependent oxidoreductase n=1 Tax=Labilibaculum euxinus TaxID=2686357 RepID=UPI000F61FD11|nr:NAD(P)/FAD-dependent oxidoreductase [Labilibaculum euxinus]MDQ1772331.1 NAD(P)/FAD-dependent oxidoreductase [Labilibaculum euxinus]MWN77971.1 NAD(P)/FAD-dependent oxidoreductase [Labilibaculum euxinus]
MDTIKHIPENGKTRIVIIGGGFAGLKLARKLVKTKYQVVLIDKNNFHQFQPLFYQVATSGLEPSSIAFPLRKIFQKRKNVHFRMAELLEVNPNVQKIYTSLGSLKYDHLVLATGVDTNYFGNKNIEEFGIPMKSVSEAIFLRNSILRNYEKALNESDPKKAANYMNIVLVGGGPTGVELAGALAEMKNEILPKDYPELDFSLMNVYLFEASDRLLSGMSEKASEKAKTYLEKLGVIVKTEARVADYDGLKISLADGEEFYSYALVWAAGVVANSIKGISEIAASRGGRLRVDMYNKVSGLNNVYALGDLALQKEGEYQNGHPQVAQVGLQQAAVLGKNLINIQQGKSMKPFHYKDRGSLATIGKNLAVADLPGIKTQGFLAWILWLFVHLMAIVGVKNRFFILINWVWNYWTSDQSLRVLIRPDKRSFTDRASKRHQIKDPVNLN